MRIDQNSQGNRAERRTATSLLAFATVILATASYGIGRTAYMLYLLHDQPSEVLMITLLAIICVAGALAAARGTFIVAQERV